LPQAAGLDGGSGWNINVIETSSQYHMVCDAFAEQCIISPSRWIEF